MSKSLLADRNLNLGDHTARQLDDGLVRSYELILAMEARHVDWIHKSWPYSRGRVFRWGRWMFDSVGVDVPDPLGQDKKCHQNALELIEQGLKDWAQRLGL